MIGIAPTTNPTHCGTGVTPVSQRVTVTRWTPRYAARPDCESPASMRSVRSVSGVTAVTGFPLGKGDRVAVGEMFRIDRCADSAIADATGRTPRGVAYGGQADVSEFGSYGMEGLGYVVLLGRNVPLLALHPSGDHEDGLAEFAECEGWFHVRNRTC